MEMADHNYNVEDYDMIMQNISNVISRVHKHTKDGESIGPDQLKDKLGSKRDMSELIIDFCNMSSGTQKFLKRVHDHNFDLWGKVVNLAMGILKQVTAEMHGIQSGMAEELQEVKDKLS